MKTALIQLNTAWKDRHNNFERASAFANKAAADNCDLIVFPEMFSTGFSMDLEAIADEGIGETTSILSTIARDNRINLIAGFPIKSPAEDKGRNIAVAYDSSGMLVSTFTKMHPFCLADEDKYYIVGNNVTVFDIGGVSSSMFICYDLRFPEIFRRVAEKVTAIFVIANWPASRKEHWEALLKARAIENLCFVVGVNRTGTDGNGIVYSGGSCIFGPSGETVCPPADEKDEYVTCEFRTEEVDEVRSQYPFLKDMRLCDDKEE